VRYGQQHGTLVRTAFPATDAERAKFEVPGQRWAHVSDGERGLAVFARDLYGWNAVGLDAGGVRLGTGARAVLEDSRRDILEIRDLVEIAILGLAVYLFLRFLGKTRGAGIVRGLGLVAVGLFLVAQVVIASFDLTVLGRVLDEVEPDGDDHVGIIEPGQLVVPRLQQLVGLPGDKRLCVAS